MTVPILARAPARGHQDAAYYSVLVAMTVGVLLLGPHDLVPTLTLVASAWLLATIALAPSRARSGAGLLVVVTVAFLSRNYAELPTAARVWAFAGIGVCMSAFVLQPLRRNDFFPYLHLFCVVQAAYLYVSVCMARPLDNDRFLYTPQVRTVGFMFLTLFSLTMVVTGILATALLRSRLDRAVAGHEPRLSTTVVPRAYVLIIGGTVLYLAAIKTGLATSLGTISDGFRLLAFGGGLILTWLWMDRRLATLHKVILLLGLAAIALYGLAQGILYQAAIPGILFLGLYVARRRRAPWAVVLVAVFAFVVLNSVKTEFRQDKRAGTVSGSMTELGVAYLDRTGQSLGTGEQETLTSAADRFSTSNLTGYFVTQVPSSYPYFGYSSYLSLPTILIPRILFPGKPSYPTANEIGRRYEVIGEFDYETSVNTPLAAESYVAGGPMAMVTVAVVCGAALALAGFALRARSPAATLAGAVLTYQVVGMVESGILGLFLLVPYGVAMFAVMRWACARSFAPSTGESPSTP